MTFVMFGGRMLIRRHIERLLFLQGIKTRLIKKRRFLIQENRKKELRLFREFFFSSYSQQNHTVLLHIQKLQKFPGQHVRRVVFSFMKTVLNQADEHGCDIVCV